MNTSILILTCCISLWAWYILYFLDKPSILLGVGDHVYKANEEGLFMGKILEWSPSHGFLIRGVYSPANKKAEYTTFLMSEYGFSKLTIKRSVYNYREIVKERNSKTIP